MSWAAGLSEFESRGSSVEDRGWSLDLRFSTFDPRSFLAFLPAPNYLIPCGIHIRLQLKGFSHAHGNSLCARDLRRERRPCEAQAHSRHLRAGTRKIAAGEIRPYRLRAKGHQR